MSELNIAVRTVDLIKRFGGHTALAGVDFSLPTGSVCLLAGTNGAGKSTFLRTLINREIPTSGRCEVLGLDPQRQGPAVRAKIGYVPETTVWGYPWMRVGQMLAHVASDYPAWDSEYASQLAKLLDVDPDRRLGNLSKGQRRCVQIVAALAHRPSLLLFDELTDGLDPIVRDRVLRLFPSHVADTNCSAILSTHLVDEIAALADQVAILRSGQMLFQGSAESLSTLFSRVELDAPSGWSPPPALKPLLVRAEASIGRSPSLIFASPNGDLESAISSSGATIRQTHHLGIAEAVLTFLQSDPS